MENKYLQFNQVDNETTELFIYGDIRKGSLIEKLYGIDDKSRTDAYTFAEKLSFVDTPNLVVRINSYGGSVSEALAIYNLLKNCKCKVKTVCDGFACSAASVVFCAGEERIMPKTSLIMIHNAWTSGVSGNANELRKQAEDLEKITQPSIEAYKSVSSLSEEEIKELMNEESWINADEAFEWGFATEVKDADVQQSLDKFYLAKLVAENKELKSKISVIEENATKTDKNGWGKFFNTKN